MGHTDWDNSSFSFCILAGKTQGSETARAPKKKRKRPQKKSRERQEKVAEPRAQTLGEKSLAASGAGKPAAVKDEKASGSTGGPTGGALGCWAGPAGIHANVVLSGHKKRYR